MQLDDLRFITSPAAIPPGIQVAVVGAREYGRAMSMLVNHVSLRDASTVYVTSNRPAEALLAKFPDEGIESRALTIIDCVTALIGVTPSKRPGVFFIESPTLLEQAGMRAQQVLRRRPDSGLVIVDSLSAFAAYTGVPTVIEWVGAFVSRLRQEKTDAILMVMATPSSGEMLEQIVDVCDGAFRL